MRPGTGDERLRMGGVKLFMDGSIQCFTCAFRERYVDRAVKQVQADLKAKNPLFKTPHLTWDRYAALLAERRREKRLAWLHAAYPTPAVLLEKIRQMPTVKLRHQRREAKEAYLGRDLD